MRNEGTSAWPENTRLAFVGGDKVSNLEAVTVAPVQPGQEIDIAVDMVAPSTPGRYVSYWRLCQPDGSRFGQRVWVDVFVQNPASSNSPAPAAAPSSDPAVEVVTPMNPAVNPAEPTIVNSPQPTVANPPEPTVVNQPEPVVVQQPAPSPVVETKAPAPATPVQQPPPPVSMDIESKQQPKSQPAPLSPQVQLLVDMGFTNAELNKQLLQNNGGDILKTVQDLLSR